MAPGLQAAILLSLLRLRLLPRCCSAGRRRGESTSRALGGSHGARGRREPRISWCWAGRRALGSRGAEALLLRGLRRAGAPLSGKYFGRSQGCGLRVGDRVQERGTST